MDSIGNLVKKIMNLCNVYTAFNEKKNKLYPNYVNQNTLGSCDFFSGGLYDWLLENLMAYSGNKL